MLLKMMMRLGLTQGIGSKYSASPWTAGGRLGLWCVCWCGEGEVEVGRERWKWGGRGGSGEGEVEVERERWKWGGRGEEWGGGGGYFV